jgi:hypothetical protein
MIFSKPRDLGKLIDSGHYLSINRYGTVYLERDGQVIAGDPITAVVGAGIGAVGSILGGKEAASGQEAAAETTAEAGRYSADLQKEMYMQGRADITPYSTLGTTASPLLQYLVTGIMPEMTQADLDIISRQNALGAAPQVPTAGIDQPLAQEQPVGPQTPGNIFGLSGDISMTPGADGTYIADGTPAAGEDLDQFALANALARQQSINALQGGWQMQESPMYSWQQEQGERALNRQAAAKGLSGSRASLNALSDFTRGLGAQEADKQYGRLLDLTNIGRGMAATGVGAGQTYAAGAGGAMMGGAQQSALYSGMAAQTKGSMYENIGQGLGQMATNYLGGGGGGGSTGTYLAPASSFSNFSLR